MQVSLMNCFNEQPSTQSFDALWGELPKKNYIQIKKTDGESDVELPIEMTNVEKGQENKVCMVLKKVERKKYHWSNNIVMLY